MKGRRPGDDIVQLPPGEVQLYDDRSLTDACPYHHEGHCFHYVNRLPDSVMLVCCHCGQHKWEVSHYWYDKEGHGPHVQQEELPANPYITDAGAYKRSERRAREYRPVPRSDPDEISPGLVDRSVAKWISKE